MHLTVTLKGPTGATYVFEGGYVGQGLDAFAGSGNWTGAWKN